MSAIRMVALVLIAAGAVMLGYTAVTYTSRETVLDVGPVEVTKASDKAAPLLPIAGGVAVALGVGLLVSAGRRKV